MVSLFKKDRLELEVLTDINMLMMLEKGIRGRICHAVHRYEFNKYMISYDKNIELSYLMYLDPINLYRWAMSQKCL